MHSSIIMEYGNDEDVDVSKFDEPVEKAGPHYMNIGLDNLAALKVL